MKKLISILALSLLYPNILLAYDFDKYAKCYGEMTNAHKARGFHQSNRSMSIEIKETVCKSFANGEINSYEGKSR